MYVTRSLEQSIFFPCPILNIQPITKIGLLMFQYLELLISSDSFFKNKENKTRFQLLLEDYRNKRQIEGSNIEWMMNQNGLTYS